MLAASGLSRSRHPGWYHNMRLNPDVIVELGRERREMRARVTVRAERDELWTRTTKALPFFAHLERASARRIPIVVLEPV